MAEMNTGWPVLFLTKLLPSHHIKHSFSTNMNMVPLLVATSCGRAAASHRQHTMTGQRQRDFFISCVVVVVVAAA